MHEVCFELTFFQLKFDMSLVYNYQQFSDIVYQAYLTKHDIGVVAAGGCYDFLLSHFSTVPTAPNAKVGASRFTTSLQEGYRVRNCPLYHARLTGPQRE